MSVHQSPLLLDRRFRGPARSGNGGYTAGRLALRMPAVSADAAASPVTVTLRRPPPLDFAMEVRRVADEGGPGVQLLHGDALVASATAGVLSADPVAPATFDTATAARASYRGLLDHPFPECFVCGPDREPGDGLHLAPGPIDDGRTACVWMPDRSLESGTHGVVGVEFVWAALDCPGGWTSALDTRPLVLGRMTAQCLALPKVGQPLVVVGQLLRHEGRKTYTASSLYDGDHLLARAEHVWLEVDPALFSP
jgi:hypothetical protein